MLIRLIEMIERKSCLEIIILNLFKVNIKDYPITVIEELEKSYRKNFLNRPETITIVAEEKGKVLGTASITEAGQVRDVFVRTGNHSKGIGRELMQHLEVIAKNK